MPRVSVSSAGGTILVGVVDGTRYVDGVADPLALEGRIAIVAEMRRFAHGEAFDERAMPEPDSEAIDFRAASSRSVIVGTQPSSRCGNNPTTTVSSARTLLDHPVPDIA